MQLTRILVAVNALQTRDAAFERALALARTFGAELYLLHAAPRERPFSFRAADRLTRLDAMRARAEAAGVPVDTTEQQGDPAALIDLHARARGVDLIVIGGEGASKRRKRSTVADAVIRRASVPTLVVMSDRPDAASSFRDLLVAVDLSPAAGHVVETALALAGPEARHLTVLHSIKGLEGRDAVRSAARWTVPEYRAHVIRGARRGLDTVLARVPAGLDTDVHVTTGPVARAVLDHAADREPDLVVLGRSAGRALFSKTAQRVLRGNDRALLVVPESSVLRTAPVERRAA